MQIDNDYQHTLQAIQVLEFPYQWNCELKYYLVLLTSFQTINYHQSKSTSKGGRI